jgi:hypothetical protein
VAVKNSLQAVMKYVIQQQQQQQQASQSQYSGNNSQAQFSSHPTQPLTIDINKFKK